MPSKNPGPAIMGVGCGMMSVGCAICVLAPIVVIGIVILIAALGGANMPKKRSARPAPLEHTGVVRFLARGDRQQIDVFLERPGVQLKRAERLCAG